ncbi:MAG: InlB B-repeat-containing protein, partial [Solobacterium sp.]|nr:InlB B-repeat-containing protein [Solobacterium sp.]
MRKLFLSTLSLLLLFGSADRGLLLNTIAEETEPAEATPETSPEVSPEPSAETADPAPEVQEEDPQSEEEAPAAVEEAPAKEAEEEAAKDEPDASQVQSIALDGDDPEVVSNYTIWYEPNSELFNTRYCTWNLDGEEIEFAEEGVSKEYQTGQDFVCPENAPVSPGLTFLGWSLSKEGPAEFVPGKSYPAFEVDPEGDPIALYAQWETEIYSVTVELNGGRLRYLNNNQVFYDFRQICKWDDDWETKYDEPPYTQGGNYSPVVLDEIFEEADFGWKPGYELEGYYLDPSFTELFVGYVTDDEGEREWTGPVFSFEKEPRNCTLYAKWTPRTYNIIYELEDDETAEGNPEKFTSGESIELNDAVKEGYEFVGWGLEWYDYQENPLTLRVLSVDEILEINNAYNNKSYGILSDEDIILYPVFVEGKIKEDSYTIEYNFSSDIYDVKDVLWDAYDDFVTGNTSYEADDRNYGTNSKYKCPSVKPTATGLTFQGWSRTKDGPTEFKSGSSYASLAEKPGIKVTLYAVWKPNTYTLKINLNGGTFPEMNLLSASTKYDFCLLKNPEDEECVVTSSGNYSAETVAEMLF